MTFKLDSRFIGNAPIEQTQPIPPVGVVQGGNYPYPFTPPGLLVLAEDPVWGTGEFLFGKAGGTIRLHALCVLTPTFNVVTRTFDPIFTECPNTGNLGRPLYIAMGEGFAPDGVNAALINQFCYFMDSGVQPVNGTATVAAGVTFGIAAAGQIGANSAGKQALNAITAQPATATVVRALTGSGPNNVAGGTIIQLVNVDGLFVGGYVAGTGVGAAAIISAIDRLNNVITVTVANTAAVTGSVTQTANNGVIFYNAVHMDRSFAQGAIT